MSERCFSDIIALISTHLFKECNELGAINLAQVHNVINILVKANIPFDLRFNETTRSRARSIKIEIAISPTSTITKVFQLQEGNIIGVI